MEDDEHMQNTPPLGIYVKVVHLPHLSLSVTAFLLVKSK